MTSRQLLIKEIFRSPEFGVEDRLVFEPGVNVIVGVPNTGKTKWLRMLDYLFGNDGRPEEIFGEDLANKYESVGMEIIVAEEAWTIQRQWKEVGSRTKIKLNGEVMDINQASYSLMEKLGIPLVHYPQGNPHGSRTWPELGWRTLLRHIYRRQALWSDLADSQPDSEQHACIMQFLGIAEYLFSKEFSDLVSKEKKIMELQSEREQFILMLQEVSREVIDEKELGVALTPDSIDQVIRRIKGQVTILQERRNAILSSLLRPPSDADEASSSVHPGDVIEQLGERLSRFQLDREQTLNTLRKSEERMNEIEQYRKLITDEYSRMRRAMDAGSVLAALKITNCPACDREVTRPIVEGPSCYLCNRSFNGLVAQSLLPEQRLKFELEQLEGELKEADQLSAVLLKDIEGLKRDLEHATEQISQIQRTLVPFRSAIASVMPPEVAVLDIEMGSLHERLKQIERIKGTLGRREKIAGQISKIQETVAALRREVADQAMNIDFEQASTTLEDGMNTYLNSIEVIKAQSWTQEQINVRLREKAFRFAVGKSDWKAKLGGTLTLYFLLSYHYALMTLTGYDKYHYPGLVILDFPAELEDATSVKDKENFVLEPFVELASRPGMESIQVIAAGSAFEDLKGANRIELTRIW